MGSVPLRRTIRFLHDDLVIAGVDLDLMGTRRQIQPLRVEQDFERSNCAFHAQYDSRNSRLESSHELDHERATPFVDIAKIHCSAQVQQSIIQFAELLFAYGEVDERAGRALQTQALTKPVVRASE